MNEAVQDRISEGGLADDVVPFVDWKLAGDQCRSGAVAVFDNLHEVTALVWRGDSVLSLEESLHQ